MSEMMERLESYQLLIVRHDPDLPGWQREDAEGELLSRGECCNPDCGCHPRAESA